MPKDVTELLTSRINTICKSISTSDVNGESLNTFVSFSYQHRVFLNFGHHDISLPTRNCSSSTGPSCWS